MSADKRDTVLCNIRIGLRFTPERTESNGLNSKTETDCGNRQGRGSYHRAAHRGPVTCDAGRVTIRSGSTPVVIQNTKSAYEAIISMFVEDVGSIYVVDDKNLLVGVVSRKDLLKLATNTNGDMKTIPVVMAMTPLSKMVMAFPDTTVSSAARKVIDNQIDSLPVVRCVNEKTKDYEVIGRITKTNFTRLFVDIAEGREVGHHK